MSTAYVYKQQRLRRHVHYKDIFLPVDGFKIKSQGMVEKKALKWNCHF